MGKWMMSSASAVVAMLLLGQAPAQANSLFFQMNPNFNGQGERQLFLFGPANSTGTVTGASGFSATFDLGAEGFTVVDIPRSLELLSNTVQDRGFRVDAEAAISGYFLSRNSATTDSTFLIDGDRLGTDHFVLGYQNVRQDQVSAQATQDNTSVTFTRPGGAQETVVLNAGQTFMITASSQLTGTRVQSDKPIAVFSGNNCTNIPTGVSACDHIVEQMPPADALSTRYLLAQTVRTGTPGNVVRVVATADATEVRANDTLVATLDTGQFWEGRVAGGVELVANNKILVGQYLIGQGQAGANTDPAMTIVPGQDQWLSSYVFSPPLGSASFANDFIQIVIDTSSIDTLRLDGASVDAGLFSQLASTIFSFGNIDVSDKTGRFTIEAATPFQLLLMGFQSFDSYFTYGGAAFAPGASPPPPPPPPPPGDTDVFWDGDGNPNNGVVDGGDGVLTATSLNLTIDDGVTNNTLPLDPANIIFTGTPGVVTVDTSLGAVRIIGLEFRVSGYSVVGDALALGGATTMLVDGDADALATVDAVLSGEFGLTKTGAGRLILNGENLYTGGTTVAAGTLEGSATSFGTGDIAIDATLVVNQPVNADMANVLTGAGQFVKRGDGRLTLTADSSFAGLTTVEAGRLQVEGDLGGSAVTVADGASLGGNGTVGAVDLLSGSQVAPGASIGTINVAGDYVQAAGAVYEAEVLSTGESDLILVTGEALLEPGAALQLVKLDAAPFVLGTRYTVLTADGGLTGTFSLSGPTVVSAFINVVDSYDANNAYLDVLQTRALAAAGRTPNQIAAARGADSAGNGAMFNALVYLPSDDAARAAFDQISGEIHASTRGATLQDSRFVREAVGSRLGSELPGRSLWIHGFGASGRFDSDGNAARVRRDIGGFFIGGDLPFGEDFVGGLVAGYSGGNVKASDRNSRAEVSDFHLGGYVAYRGGQWRGHVGLANMWRDVKTRRTVGFGGFSDSLRGNYDLSLFQIFADVGYRVPVGGVELEPYAALAYVDVGSSRFSERGGEASLSNARSNSSGFLVTQLGGRLHVGMGSAAGGLGAVASLGWRNYSGDDQATPLSMGFAAGPAFSIAGAPIARDVATFGLSIAGKVAERVEIDVGYSGQAGGGLSDHGGRASLIFRF